MANDVTFLIVEDDEIDVLAIERTFQQLKIVNRLVVARDGIEGLEYMRGTGGREKLEDPLIVLLDLNMPRMNGLEFLHEIRNDPQLRRTVVFVLTTSNEERDRVSAYESNVAGYIIKTNPARGVMDGLSLIDHYWRVVELP